MIKKLTLIFSEVVHASELKIIQPASDISIWNYAKKHGFTIISKDDDLKKNSKSHKKIIGFGIFYTVEK
jgi:predicted nuclease of predicted toxin-antitoxin system